MPGQVFLSCGQHEKRNEGEQDEKAIAEDVKRVLEEEFGLTVYLAAREQSLDDVMKTLDELALSDYMLFIDFFRPDQPVPFSLFSHQELAIASHLQIEYIGFKQEGAPGGGFLAYTLANPITFKDNSDLIDSIRSEVSARRWNAEYSRNLTVRPNGISMPMGYGDHAGAPEVTRIITARVTNGRSYEAARNVVCILREWVEPSGNIIQSDDRSALKWAGRYRTYSATILPEDHSDIDLLALSVDPNRLGAYLHSEADNRPREPIFTEPGEYVLRYRLFADGFGVTDFELRIVFSYMKTKLAIETIDAVVDEWVIH